MNNKRKATETKTSTKRPRNETRYEKELGDSKFVVVSEFEGGAYVHIRLYDKTNGKKFPTKKGAVLTPLRWREFVFNIEEIEEAVRDLSTDKDFDYTQHLGGN